MIKQSALSFLALAFLLAPALRADTFATPEPNPVTPVSNTAKTLPPATAASEPATETNQVLASKDGSKIWSGIAWGAIIILVIVVVATALANQPKSSGGSGTGY